MTTYGDFKQITLKDIRSFINKREEDLHLDFKLAKAPMTRDDRKNFAIAASDFSNADSGIIIWGVDARRDQTTNLDIAISSQPIASLTRFMGDLHDHTGGAAHPIIDGIEHRGIEESPDMGYAITYVPQSDTGPHMAKLGEDRYYKRTGSRFVVMEHYEISDMFGRRQRPVLAISAQQVSSRRPATMGRVVR
ncbi:MAG: AlbA family DNA-binding domain-containing protein, partial [bacterium]